MAGITTTLLGFMGTGAVSLSSVKKKEQGKSRVSSHGQGGAGKTTMAALVVRSDMVRRAFDRIGWISVGQTPDILEMQRTLYFQLTDESEAGLGATPEAQLVALQEVRGQAAAHRA